MNAHIVRSAAFAALAISTAAAALECEQDCLVKDAKWANAVVAGTVYDGKIYHQPPQAAGNFKWDLEPVPREAGYYYLRDNSHGRYLVAGDAYDGRVYHQFHNGRDNAKWRFEPVPGSPGQYFIKDKKHGKGLAAGDAFVDGNVYHQDPTGRANAKWVLVKTAAPVAAPVAPTTPQGPSACPAGQHPDKQSPVARCLFNDFVPHVAKLTSPNQQAERAAWTSYNAHVAKYDGFASTYRREKTEVEALENKINSGNCGQFACQTQDLKSRRSSHEQAADRAKGGADAIVPLCEKAEADIRAARVREDAAKEEHVSKRVPSCPEKLGEAKIKCPEGKHYRMGKCISDK
ncbi:RICIN domain-containing protein [Usitatibacter palustris]|uniref:Ricin B lectin domain-containing protein n=1 Tax=Usitatibacter palustris TaxID=2732487 RepID=A0A6M4HBH9_9PROT|nr:hypothetical protein [Usitatibacter palustris]QJR15327.1 hypothetical protein DSM104440_02146 [Usitatibacter palustris]